LGDIVGFGIVAVAVGSAAVGVGRKIYERWSARRELRAKQPLDAGSPEGAVVRVTGVVRVLDETFLAPLSGRTCVVARSRVSAGNGMTSRALRPKESITMVRFVIDRGAEGQVVIEGKHVLLDLAPLRIRSQKFERLRREQFLVAQAVPLRETGRARFEETIVEPGSRVSVAGLVMKDLPAEPVADELGFRETAPPNLRLAGNVEHPLVIGEPVD
jgi:hypothetical protein